MAREVNAAAVIIATTSEGTAYIAYLDPTGKLTAGQGHTGSDVQAGIVYSRTQVDAWRVADLARAGAFVESRTKVPLSDNQFSALAEFTFNVGTGNFAGSTLLRLLNKGQYTAIPAQLARWNKGRVNGKLTVLAGLTRRRILEAKLFEAPDGANVPVPASMPLAIAAPAVAPSAIEAFRAWLHGLLHAAS